MSTHAHTHTHIPAAAKMARLPSVVDGAEALMLLSGEQSTPDGSTCEMQVCVCACVYYECVYFFSCRGADAAVWGAEHS